MSEPWRARALDNAFDRLGLHPGASRREIENAARASLDALELAIHGATEFQSVLGPRPRDAQGVREARSCLRDPEQRAREHLWWLLARELPESEAETDS